MFFEFQFYCYFKRIWMFDNTNSDLFPIILSMIMWIVEIGIFLLNTFSHTTGDALKVMFPFYFLRSYNKYREHDNIVGKSKHSVTKHYFSVFTSTVAFSGKRCPCSSSFIGQNLTCPTYLCPYCSNILTN